MRIENPTYSRVGVRVPQQRQYRPSNSLERKREVAEQPLQSKKVELKHFNRRETVLQQGDRITDQDIKSLSDVLTPEEQAMLLQLFPGNGNGWGEAAYKVHSAGVNFSVILGTKLDVIS